MKLNELKALIKKIIILEGFKEVKQRFITQGAVDAEIDDAFDKFNNLKAKGLIKGQEANIERFATFKDLIIFIDSKKDIKTNREMMRDSKVFYDGEDYRVAQPLSWEASCKLGTGTNWCVSVAGNKKHWDDYTIENNRKFVMIWDKETGAKWALEILPTFFPGDKSQINNWNSADKKNTVDTNTLIAKYNIKDSWLKNHQPVDENWFINKKIKFRKNSDGSYDVLQNLDLSNMGLSKLPFLA